MSRWDRLGESDLASLETWLRCFKRGGFLGTHGAACVADHHWPCLLSLLIGELRQERERSLRLFARLEEEKAV